MELSKFSSELSLDTEFSFEPTDEARYFSLPVPLARNGIALTSRITISPICGESVPCFSEQNHYC